MEDEIGNNENEKFVITEGQVFNVVEIEGPIIEIEGPKRSNHKRPSRKR